MRYLFLGDQGDYMKLAILRALGPGCRVGVVWWLVQEARHEYLDDPDTWRDIDNHVFDELERIVQAQKKDEEKRIEKLERLIGAHCVSREPIPQSEGERNVWFSNVIDAMEGCDLVFIDPDKGLELESFSPGSARSVEYIQSRELRALKRPKRCLILYQHPIRQGTHEG